MSTHISEKEGVRNSFNFQLVSKPVRLNVSNIQGDPGGNVTDKNQLLFCLGLEVSKFSRTSSYLYRERNTQTR